MRDAIKKILLGIEPGQQTTRKAIAREIGVDPKAEGGRFERELWAVITDLKTGGEAVFSALRGGGGRIERRDGEVGAITLHCQSARQRRKGIRALVRAQQFEAMVPLLTEDERRRQNSEKRQDRLDWILAQVKGK